MRTPRGTPSSAGRRPPERDGAEERLRQSEARFRSVFDHAPMGILLLDGQACIVEANQALLRMLGYAEDEMRGRAVGDFIHPEDRLESDRTRDRVMAGEI